MSKIIWAPSEKHIQDSNLYHFLKFAGKATGKTFSDYNALYSWSIDCLEDSWVVLADFFEIKFSGKYEKVVSDESEMYQKKWFSGAYLSYSKLIFRNNNAKQPAIIYKCENQEVKSIAWHELETSVANLAYWLKSTGFQKGDTAVAYSSNNVETIIAFLAVNSLGGIWSSCSPDFGSESVIERFGQIKPRVFFANSSYQYNGKSFDILQKVEEIQNGIGSDLNTILFESKQWSNIISQEAKHSLEFTEVEFNDPIWVLYSSGTTGKPKAIVHRTGGMVLEHLKALALHQNVKKGERYCWYSTTGWMMWNYALSSLLTGATLCLYDGSVAYPDLNVLWDFVDDQKINHLGAGAAFFQSCLKSDIYISGKNKLLKTIGSTGSPLSEEAFNWLSDKITGVPVISLSGGTDVCSAFIGGNPMLPVISGEIQCRMLGAAIEAWDENGESVNGDLGELVIAKPMPSMPVFFWNDNNNEKYKSSYFEKYPGVWCHGDWIKITENRGIIVFGRSDATLNRGGVRIGTAEIYSAVETLEFIKDSLIVCIEKENGDFYMPLFVKTDKEISDVDKKAINTNLRGLYSPRHVPDEIIITPDIPYTISGKKMEMAVKKILMGASPEKAATRDAMKNPESLDWYVDLYINYVK
ncbi:MAG: acetoacetate--CoA ligase [Cytophagaceae bacterium]|nr:acetoacetate--CoA ligase [Cytophagaceae bacterium]